MQLGTLGSGNHFIEVVLDERSRVWLFLHSGSRGIGNKIAQRHIATAARLCRQWWVPLPDPRQGRSALAELVAARRRARLLPLEGPQDVLR